MIKIIIILLYTVNRVYSAPSLDPFAVWNFCDLTDIGTNLTLTPVNISTCTSDGLYTDKGLITTEHISTEFAIIESILYTETYLFSTEILYKLPSPLSQPHFLFGFYADNPAEFPFFVILHPPSNQIIVSIDNCCDIFHQKRDAGFSVSPNVFNHTSTYTRIIISVRQGPVDTMYLYMCYGFTAIPLECSVQSFSNLREGIFQWTGKRLRLGPEIATPGPSIQTYYAPMIYSKLAIYPYFITPETVQEYHITPGPTPLPSTSPTISPSLNPSTMAPTQRLPTCQVSSTLVFACNLSQTVSVCPPYIDLSLTTPIYSSVGVYGLITGTLPFAMELVVWYVSGEYEIPTMSFDLVSDTFLIGDNMVKTLGISGYTGTPLSQEDLACLESRPPHSLPILISTEVTIQYYYYPIFFDADDNSVVSFKVTQLPGLGGRLYYLGDPIELNQEYPWTYDKLQYVGDPGTDTFYMAGYDGYGEFGPPAQVTLTVIDADIQKTEDLEWAAQRSLVVSVSPFLQYTFTQSECHYGTNFSTRADIHVPLNRSSQVTCHYLDGYAGPVRQGALMLGTYASLTSFESAKTAFPIFSGKFNETMLEWTFETWVEFTLPGFQGGQRQDIGWFGIRDPQELDYRFIIKSSTVFQTRWYPFLENILHVQNGPFCDTQMGEIRNGELALFHLVQTFKITELIENGYNYQSQIFVSKEGNPMGICRYNGSNFFAPEELAANPFGFYLQEEHKLIIGGGGGLSSFFIDGIGGGTLLSLSVFNKALTQIEVEGLFAVGHPKSSPVPVSNHTFQVYEDLFWPVNLSEIAWYDYDGDNVTHCVILALPVSGILSFNGEAISELPLWVSPDVQLVYLSDGNVWGSIDGFQVSFSDDGLNYSPVPSQITIYVNEINDAPEPNPLYSSYSVLRGFGVHVTFGFIDPDDSIQDVLGNIPDGAMIEDDLLRDGTSIQLFAQSTHLREIAGGCSLPISTLGVGRTDFTYCFNATGLDVGLYTLTYTLTDPANLTSTMNGTVDINVLPNLVACTQEIAVCHTYDSFVYLQGKDTLAPLLPASIAIVSLPTMGTLRLNGPSPSPVSLNQTYTSALIPNFLYTPSGKLYTASGFGTFVDLKGDPLPPPDIFTFQVVRGSEPRSLVYNYTLYHVAPEFAQGVNITCDLEELEEGPVKFNITLETANIRVIEVLVSVTTGKIRLVAPYSLLAPVILEGDEDFWALIGRFEHSEIRFTPPYPSLATEILQYLEYEPPTTGVRNGTHHIEVLVYDEISTRIGSLEIPIIGDRGYDASFALRVLKIVAAFYTFIATLSLWATSLSVLIGVTILASLYNSHIKNE